MGKDLKISIIGSGALGGSVAAGLKQRFESVSVFDVDPVRAREMREKGFDVADDMKSAVTGFDLVLWALKPHLMVPAVRENSSLLSGAFCCSLAACVELDLLSAAAPSARWSRVMTNLCASIGKAFAGYTLSANVSPQDKSNLEQCLSSLGFAVSVPESALDAITGIAGSGPAYVFTILESFIQGGLASGLPADVSLRAAAMTLIGASELVLKENMHPAVFKDRVCTPAGTTIDGLRILEAGGVRTSLIDAIVTASEKGRSGSRALREKFQEKPDN